MIANYIGKKVLLIQLPQYTYFSVSYYREWNWIHFVTKCQMYCNKLYSVFVLPCVICIMKYWLRLTSLQKIRSLIIIANHLANKVLLTQLPQYTYSSSFVLQGMSTFWIQNCDFCNVVYYQTLFNLVFLEARKNRCLII